MISTEAQLLDVLQDCGFDFSSTVRELAMRLPTEAPLAVPPDKDVVFRLPRPFAGFGPLWKVPIRREVDVEIPVGEYRHEYSPTRDVRENFNAGLKNLEPLLGPGENGIGSNVLKRDWQVGNFRILLVSWPLELNREYVKLFPNRKPHVWISANVDILPRYPYMYRNEDGTSAMEVIFFKSKEVKPVLSSKTYLRRNRAIGQREMACVGVVPMALLIRAHDRTVRVPLEEIQRVELVRFTPSQFSGKSKLSIETRFLGRRTTIVQVATGAKTESLDQIASQLAQKFAKPLDVKECPDEK